MEAAAAHRNFVATTAVAATIIRVLVPIAGRAGRAAWHWWNQSNGEVRKDENAPEVGFPEELTQAADQQQRQQQQQQQSPLSLTIPSGSGKKRTSPLYSKEPNVKGSLLQDFDVVKKESATTTTTCQFGPARVVTKDDYSNAVQLQHDTDKN